MVLFSDGFYYDPSEIDIILHVYPTSILVYAETPNGLSFFDDYLFNSPKSIRGEVKKIGDTVCDISTNNVASMVPNYQPIANNSNHTTLVCMMDNHAVTYSDYYFKDMLTKRDAFREYKSDLSKKFDLDFVPMIDTALKHGNEAEVSHLISLDYDENRAMEFKEKLRLRLLEA